MKKIFSAVSSCLFLLGVCAGPAFCAELSESKKLISLDFQNTALSTVLEVMSIKTGNKFITDADLGRKSILFVLKDVTPQEALNALLDTYNLYYIRQPNTDIYIIKNRMGGDPIKTVSKVISVNYASVTDLIEVARPRLGPGGSVGADEKSNSLVISDVADNIEKIEQIIQQLDKPPLQVLLEAKIVDVSIGDDFKFGIDYNDVYRDSKMWVNPWKLGSAESKFRYGITGDPIIFNQTDQPNDPKSDFKPEVMFEGLLRPGTVASNLHLNLLAGDYNISAILGAEKKDSKGKVLSNPKLFVMNGQEATIEIVKQIPYSESNVEGSNIVVKTVFKDAGIKMKVKPVINKDRTIILNVVPEQSFVSEYTPEDQIPVIDTSRAQTVMMVKDGETAVIGGLIRETETNTMTKVPLLGDIPILGYLFRNVQKSTARSELTVFITAKIVGINE